MLLTAHKAWFVRQRCSDPFAATLNINKLQAAAAGATPAPAPAAGPERPLSASRGSGASEPAATDTPSAIAAAAAGVAARLAAAGTMLDLEYLRDDSAMEFLAAQGGVGAVGHEEEEEEASEGEGVDEAAVLQVRHDGSGLCAKGHGQAVAPGICQVSILYAEMQTYCVCSGCCCHCHVIFE